MDANSSESSKSHHHISIKQNLNPLPRQNHNKRNILKVKISRDVSKEISQNKSLKEGNLSNDKSGENSKNLK